MADDLGCCAFSISQLSLEAVESWGQWLLDRLSLCEGELAG